MSTSAKTVRRAKPAEIPAIARALARAFHDDPVSTWTCRADGLRPVVLEQFFGARMRQLAHSGEIWTTEGLAGAAVWAAPGRWKTSLREDLELARSALHPRLLLRAPIVARGLLGIERRHPPQPPHWYLAILGTEPAAQGQGLGSAMLGPVLEECDRDGVAAYLESSTERNLAFYGRHGFRVMEVWRLPRGPRVSGMWRDPRG
ncbi:MAG TPA: GNAT family N-acetyltransferase [Solirubrobacterales bacterium]|nr:GNAT family N-acetyltransferase [Solirubrobacterales bacterium]